MSTSNSLIDDLQIFVGGQNGSEKKLDEKMSQMMGDAYMHYANGSYDMHCRWQKAANVPYKHAIVVYDSAMSGHGLSLATIIVA
ncbi:hypothetical protein MTR_4g074710 [Medicago truncatula]|uniref:Uncharacterized protein n=1 Tax=Medicago truncatula TaxID=3880 RepID=G7JNI1_MEDTR|nr:hypothetical protein MTR_4g074710 [Medicago truncatula]